MASALLWLVIAYDVGFALFHVLFWRLFAWPTSLMPSGQVNGAITQTLNVMLIYVFSAYSTALAMLPAGAERTVALWLGAGFWLLRTAAQPAIFGARGKVNTLLSVLFAVGAGIHLLTAAALSLASR